MSDRRLRPMITFMSAYVDAMFRAAAAANDGVVRRQKLDVLNNRVLDEIIERAKENEWHVLESDTQIIVLCNSGHLRILA